MDKEIYYKGIKNIDTGGLIAVRKASPKISTILVKPITKPDNPITKS